MLALLLLAIVPSTGIVSKHVDLIEVNHVYDTDTGKVRLEQAIFYRWHSNETDAWLEIVDWKYLRDTGRPQMHGGCWRW